MIFVLLSFSGYYEDRQVAQVRVFQNPYDATAAYLERVEEIKADVAAYKAWEEAVNADYERLKPPGWSEFPQQKNPNTFNGKNVESWRKAAALHEHPGDGGFTEVELFVVDGQTSKRLEV